MAIVQRSTHSYAFKLFHGSKRPVVGSGEGSISMAIKGIIATLALTLLGLGLGFSINWFMPGAQTYDLVALTSGEQDNRMVLGLTHESCRQAVERQEQTGAA